MMNNSKISEFKFKKSKNVYTVIFLASLILYSIFAYSAKFILDTKKNMSISNYVVSTQQMVLAEVVSLVSFILATYALFYSISYIAIRIKEKYVNFKYKGTNLFLLGGILSKINTTPTLMATISLTFLGASISFIVTLLMSQWSLGYLDYRVPFDIELRSGYLDKRDDMSIPPLAISLSDFNKLRNMQGYEQINLANYEYTTQWDGNTEDSEIENYINQNKFLNVSGSDMKISKDGYYKETLGEGIYNYPAKNIIILPDEICKGLVGAGVDLFITTNNEMKYEDALEFEYEYIPTWFENNNKDLMKKYDSSYQFIAGRIKSAETSEILNASLGMRILGLYLGTVLLMISLTVLALQQLTDSIEHKQRFNILRKLGIEEGEINKIVLKQIGIYFAIPVTIGVIGFVVFIYNYYHIFETQMSSYVGDKMFILNMIIGIVLMIIVYVSYFLGTYYTFKRNIKN